MYIKRDDAIKALDVWGYDEYTATQIFAEIPDADVVERSKRGEWVQISIAKIYECSVCGGNVMTDDIDLYWYCHQCGAYMRKSCANGCKWSELDGSCSNPKGLCEIEYRTGNEDADWLDNVTELESPYER